MSLDLRGGEDDVLGGNLRRYAVLDYFDPDVEMANTSQFNGGPRICIGQQFALTEISYVTVRLLQRFDTMQNMEIDPVVKHNLTLTNCSGNGVKVQAHFAA